MAENIGGVNPMSSGGHVWAWMAQQLTRKRVGSVAIQGEYACVTAVGSRPGRISGKGGTGAVLKASGATRALADAALTVLENVIEGLANGGAEYAWEDDHGHTGTALHIIAYNRQGGRRYGVSGSNVVVWQFYSLDFVELNGGW